MILTAKMMPDWLGEGAPAHRPKAAVAKVIAEGHVATYDVKGRGKGSSTTAADEEVARNL